MISNRGKWLAIALSLLCIYAGLTIPDYQFKKQQKEMLEKQAVAAHTCLFQGLMGEGVTSINDFHDIRAVLQSKGDYEKNPEYSYWNITMSNAKETVHVWINSISGTVLWLEAEFYHGTNIEDRELENILKAYVKFCDMKVEEGMYGEKTASNCVRYYFKTEYGFQCFAERETASYLNEDRDGSIYIDVGMKLSK